MNQKIRDSISRILAEHSHRELVNAPCPWIRLPESNHGSVDFCVDGHRSIHVPIQKSSDICAVNGEQDISVRLEVFNHGPGIVALIGLQSYTIDGVSIGGPFILDVVEAGKNATPRSIPGSQVVGISAMPHGVLWDAKELRDLINLAKPGQPDIYGCYRGERAVEWFFESRNPAIEFEKIHTSSGKSPDYMVQMGSCHAVWEAKSMEADSITQAENSAVRETGSYHGTTAKRTSVMRRRAVSAAKQLASYADKRVPTVLVLTNFTKNNPNALTDSNIADMLYGDPVLVFTKDGLFVTSTLLHDKSLSAISAVATIEWVPQRTEDRSRVLSTMNIYHNANARIALSEDCVRELRIRQHSKRGEGKDIDWKSFPHVIIDKTTTSIGTD